MLENQAADSHISAVGTEQTAGGSQTEAVGEQTGSEGDSHITNEAAEKAFDREMNALWGLESPIAAAEAPDSGEYEDVYKRQVKQRPEQQTQQLVKQRPEQQTQQLARQRPE